MNSRWNQLDGIVRQAESRGYIVGVAVLQSDGVEYQHRGSQVVLAASTIKVAIMVTIFQHIDRGELSLNDSIVLEPAHKIPGAGVLQGLHDGLTLTLGDLLYLMISISDNPSTNLLLDKVGIDAVNETLRGLGLVESKLVRRMEGRDPRGFDNENLATPMEFALLFKQILTNNAASPKSCQQMVGYLTQQQNNRRIGRYVPTDKTVLWGSKTGTATGLVNDVGFIQGPKDTVIISVFTSGFPENSIGEELIADISRAAMSATGVVDSPS